MNKISLIWLFVGAVAAHNLEEAIWLPRWSHQAGGWYNAVTSFQFRFAVSVLSVFAAFLATCASLWPMAWNLYGLSGYALAMAINVISPHLSATVALRRYMPGTATSLLLILPTSIPLLLAMCHDGSLSTWTFLWTGPAVAVGIALTIPILLSIGSRLQTTYGYQK